MEFRRLPAETAAVRRYVEDLWLPYHRDLEAAVADHALDEGVDLVEEEIEFRIGLLESDTYRLWVAVDGAREGEGAGLAETDGEFVGFVATDIDEASPVFDRPDRLLVGDIYVAASHRGTGLADRLMELAAERARDLGCPEVTLDVDADNDRALAFYDRLGFETARREMQVSTDELARRTR